MAFDTKRLRYLYWIVAAFIIKNLQSILLSFLISLLSVITVISFAPYIINLLASNKSIIGYAGEYSFNTLPSEILTKISNGLLHIDEKGNLIPLIADSWEPINGGKEYIFHIKKDLVWNDGTPLKAYDIKYSFKDVEVAATNDYILHFKLKKPLAIFPNFLVKPIVKYPLVGVAGLYKADRIKSADGKISLLQLKPNKKGNPVIIYRFYDNENKLIQAYKLGEITQMSTSRANVVEQFKDWKNTVVEKQIDYSKVMTLFFNLNNSRLKESKDTRQALAESIDRSSMSLFGEEANSPIPPDSWAHEPNTKQYRYNPSVALKILQKTFEASESSHLVLSTYYENLEIADSIKQNFEASGVRTKLEVLVRDLPKDFQVFLAQMSLSQEPDQYYFWHSTQPGNITSYKNVRVDKLLEDGRNFYSLSKRKAIYSDFQKIIMDELPAYFLYYPYNYVIKRK